jgi:hypothetical protein
MSLFVHTVERGTYLELTVYLRRSSLIRHLGVIIDYWFRGVLVYWFDLGIS